MDRVSERGSNQQRPTGRTHSGLGPLIWIAILLTSWLVIAEWKMVPELVSAAAASLS